MKKFHDRADTSSSQTSETEQSLTASFGEVLRAEAKRNQKVHAL